MFKSSELKFSSEIHAILAEIPCKNQNENADHTLLTYNGSGYILPFQKGIYILHNDTLSPTRTHFLLMSIPGPTIFKQPHSTSWHP